MLLYCQNKHAAALQQLEPLFDHVEAIHGGAALRLCILLLEIYLSSKQHVKAASVISYLELAWGLVPESNSARTTVDELTDHDGSGGYPTM